jgi:hypothetical protein
MAKGQGGKGFATLAALALMLGAAPGQAEPNFQLIHNNSQTCASLVPGSVPVITKTVTVVQGENVAAAAKDAFMISYVVEGATIKSWQVMKPVTPPATDPGVHAIYVRYKTKENTLLAQGNYYAPDNGFGDAAANITVPTAVSINAATFCVKNLPAPLAGPATCEPERCDEGEPPYWLSVQSLDGTSLTETCSCNFTSAVCDPDNASGASEFPPCVTPGESLGDTPATVLSWANSGACYTKKIAGTVKWVCVRPQ